MTDRQSEKVEEIKSAIRESGLRATPARIATLRLLQDATSPMTWRFELSDHDDSSHPHFICVECGNISCLDEVKLTAKSLRASLEFGTITEILLRGHCNDCATIA